MVLGATIFAGGADLSQSNGITLCLSNCLPVIIWYIETISSLVVSQARCAMCSSLFLQDSYIFENSEGVHRQKSSKLIPTHPNAIPRTDSMS